MEEREKLYLISLDAVGALDMEYMSTLPNFQKFKSKSAYCEHVTSVYPSLTYPAHTSIVTGRWPKNHGIINNTMLQPSRLKPDWYYQHKRITGTTLYDELIQKGYRVAALLWPVTGGSKIQYNFPEIHPYRFWQNQITTTIAQGSAGYILGLLPFLKGLQKGVKQPALDDFVQRCALHTIKKYHPDMMMIHYLDVDFTRHGYGVNNSHVTESMKRMDARLGELLDLIYKTDDMARTTICILGDHYQKDTTRIVYLNTLLRRKGYLETKGNRITAYRVVAKNCDGSAYLYRNKTMKTKKGLDDEIVALFTELAKDATYGIERVIPSIEAGALGADENCICMLEARPGYYFLDETEVLVRDVKDEIHHKMRATHGYLPDQPEYETFFMACGRGIRKNITIPKMRLIDEGVTLARLFNVDLGETDGKVIKELLETEQS